MRRYPFVLVLLLLFGASLPGLGRAEPYARWAFQTDGPIRGEAVVRDGVVYFGSSDGFLYAVDADNGTLQWKVDTGGAIAGAPAVTADVVIVAGRGPAALAVARDSGSVRWAFELGPTLPTLTSWNFFTAAPVVDGDQVLVPSGDGFLYALGLASGAERWRFQTGDSLRASPLVADGIVYQPSGDDYVYALDARTGAEQWRFATAGVDYDLSQGFIRSDIFTRPSLRDGLLVIGSRDSNVYAIDIATHEAAWTFSYDSTWAMSTTVHDGTVFVGWSTNNKLSALDLHTGELQWDTTVGGHTYTTAAITGDAVLWGSADGHLHRFNRHTGERLGTYAVGSEIYSSPTVVGDTTYVGTDDGRLLALSESAAPVHRAVYQPTAIPDNLRGFIIDERLVPFLTARGFTLLDNAESLADWIAARRSDGSRSVLVFGYPLIPEAVVGAEPASGPLRAYLEAGGKVVWPWGMPNKLTFNPDGSFKAYDPTVAERLLGVKVLSFEDGGNYAATATQLGRNWGLPTHPKTTFSFLDPTSFDAVEPLAIDELGRPGAWLKRFSDRPGSGWVSFLPSGFGVAFTDAQLALLEHVANTGLE